jgi:phage tail-like protein
MADAVDAITASRFMITIDGYAIAQFSELQGITSLVEPVRYLSSTEKGVVNRALPGTNVPPQVVLKRGKDNSMELWSWHEAVRYGKMDVARKSCSLVMYNSEGKPVARYHMENAWPSKVEVSGMKAGANEVLFETVTLVCEFIQRVAP